MWVTADDIKQWLAAEDLVADSVKVIRNHETQESKGFAFIEAPTSDEMQAIIRRFDRAPLEDKVLRANPAQPSKGAPVVVKAPGTANRGAFDRNRSAFRRLRRVGSKNFVFQRGSVETAYNRLHFV